MVRARSRSSPPRRPAPARLRRRTPRKIAFFSAEGALETGGPDVGRSNEPSRWRIAIFAARTRDQNVRTRSWALERAIEICSPDSGRPKGRSRFAAAFWRARKASAPADRVLAPQSAIRGCATRFGRPERDPRMRNVALPTISTTTERRRPAASSSGDPGGPEARLLSAGSRRTAPGAREAETAITGASDAGAAARREDVHIGARPHETKAAPYVRAPSPAEVTTRPHECGRFVTAPTPSGPPSLRVRARRDDRGLLRDAKPHRPRRGDRSAARRLRNALVAPAEVAELAGIDRLGRIMQPYLEALS